MDRDQRILGNVLVCSGALVVRNRSVWIEELDQQRVDDQRSRSGHSYCLYRFSRPNFATTLLDSLLLTGMARLRPVALRPESGTLALELGVNLAVTGLGGELGGDFQYRSSSKFFE